jgi:hypothetical protein
MQFMNSSTDETIFNPIMMLLIGIRTVRKAENSEIPTLSRTNTPNG